MDSATNNNAEKTVLQLFSLLKNSQICGHFFDNMPLHAFAVDRNMKFVWGASSLNELLQLSPHQRPPEFLSELIDGTCGSEVGKAFDSIVLSGMPFADCTAYLEYEGCEPVLGDLFLVSLDKGTVAGYLRPRIPKMAMIEKAEDYSHSRAMSGAKSGWWDWDISADYLDFNTRFEEILGYEDGTAPHNIDALEYLIRDGGLSYPAGYKNILVMSKGHHESKFRIETPSGTIKSVFITGSIVECDDDGIPVRASGLLFDITSSSTVEQELRESRRRFATLASNLPGMVYRCKNDENWTMEYLSEGCFRLTGYKTEDIVMGITVQYADLIVDEDREYVWDSVQDGVINRSSYTMQYRIRCADGAIKWVWEQGCAVTDADNNVIALEGLIQDITDEKEIEKSLQKSEQKYRELVEDFHGVLFSVDRDGIITYINQSVATLSGYSPEDVIGLSFFRFLDDHDVALVRMTFDQALDMDAHEPIEYRIKTKMGEIRWVRSISNAYYQDGEPVGVNGVIIDITRIKAAEEEKRILEQKLRQAHKIEAVGTLAAGIAHDFNNTLTPILMNAELLLEDSIDDDVHRPMIEDILLSGNRAKELIRQILTFSRQSEQKVEAVNPASLVKETLKLLRSSLPSSIVLNHFIDTECGKILADATQIHQVIVNLVTNASQSLPGMKGTVNVSLSRTFYDPERGNNGTEMKCDEPNRRCYIHIAVTDTGSGMGPETLERIFEPFYTTKKVGEGTGMGLAVVHGIVQSHNGIIDVTSKPGQGTTFNIYFPAVESDETLHRDEVTFDENKYRGSASIMFVDDEARLVEIAKRTLSHYGYSVTGFVSSKKAIEHFNDNSTDFDLVVTDFAMPEYTGADLALSVKRAHPGIPVLMVSGYTNMSGVSLAEIGVDAFLEKPFTRITLLRSVWSIINEK